MVFLVSAEKTTTTTTTRTNGGKTRASDRPRGRPVVLGLPVRKAIDGDDEDEDEWWKDAGS
jgi:hypothetical protein